MSDLLFWIATVLVVFATVFGWVPLWKSSTLSPDSIQRRVFWTGMAGSLPLVFLAMLPDVRGAIFVVTCSALVIVMIALRWTRHVKIGQRIYGATSERHCPDRPPVLTDDGRE